MTNGYTYDDLSKFMKKIDAENKKVIDELGDGTKGTVEIVSKRSNSREDVARAIIRLSNHLVEAKKWIENIHSTHFELLNEHMNMKKLQENKTLEAIGNLNRSLEKKLEKKSSEELQAIENINESLETQLKEKSSIQLENRNSDTEKLSQVPDWTKINFTSSISEVVSKTIRSERNREKEITSKRNKFIIFGVTPEDVDDPQGRWDSYDSLVRYIADDFNMDPDRDVIKWEKLNPGKSENMPIRVTLTNGDLMQQVLRKAADYKSLSEPLNRIYFTPDRTRDQHKMHKSLVEKLRDMIKRNPERRWVIKNGRDIDAGIFRKTPYYNSVPESEYDTSTKNNAVNMTHIK